MIARQLMAVVALAAALAPTADAASANAAPYAVGDIGPAPAAAFRISDIGAARGYDAADSDNAPAAPEDLFSITDISSR